MNSAITEYSGEDLIRGRQFGLLEQLAVEQIDASIEFFFLHVSSLFGLRKFHKLISVTDLILDAHPAWFLSPVAERVAELHLMYLQSLVEIGSVSLACEKGVEFIESVISKSAVDEIASLSFLHKQSSLLLAGSIEEDTRVALSQISHLISKATNANESAYKYALVAIHFNHANVDAWHDLLSGWSLSEVDKLALLNSIHWEAGHVPKAVRGWILLPDSPLEKGIIFGVGKQGVPDHIKINQTLRRLLYLGQSDIVGGVIKQLKSEQSFLFDLDTAALVATCMYLQNDSGTLLQMANKLLAAHSSSPDAFFVAGLYYLSIQRFEVARKFFSKATNTSHGWLAYGLSFSLSDESGHAINAFRTATRLYPKCVLPWIYIAMEYIRTNELKLAQSYLVSALGLCGNDDNRFRALILNEIGVICLKAEQFDLAAENLRICCSGIESKSSSVFLANLGYSLVKVRDIEAACKAFENSVRLDRSNGNGIAGIGFCLHCKGSLARAIDLYNAALPLVSGNRKTENLVNNLIQLAVNEYSFSVKQSHLASPDHELPILLTY